MSRFDFTVRIAGENGEGVLSVGDVLAEALARVGLNVYTFKNLPAEIKGGASMVQVRLSNGPVRSPGDAVDLLMVWNRENYDLHIDSLRQGGTLLYDPDECEPDWGRIERQYPIPLNQIVREEIRQTRSKNVLAFGVLTSYLGVEQSIAERMVAESRWGRRKQLLEANLMALRAGYHYVAEYLPPNGIPLPDLEGKTDHLFLTGNQALCLGALTAGLHLYAGYPITPASDIMEELAKHLPLLGGVVVQTEDEIAALATVIGASFAGKKAMTASSGPGISLMVEQMGLATMQELPLVIVDCQRGGPSTGLPTKVEQSDLDLAIYGRHGDAPRIVVAPLDVEDCFYTTIQAFNLAEKYQTPVILLSDQHLSQRSQSVPRFDPYLLPILDRLTPTPEECLHYQRYRPSAEQASPMALPGIHEAIYCATGLEHDERAEISTSPDVHQRMSQRRADKIARAAREPGMVEWIGPEQAELGIITWGSSSGPVLEALERAQEKGYSVAALLPRMLAPLRTEEITRFMDQMDQVAVAELNYSGQFARYIQAHLCRPVRSLTQCTGLPFRPSTVLDFIEEALKDGHYR
jgi:2-oxoglutarate ferredoxin oxidoreductase subunit alpha